MRSAKSKRKVKLVSLAFAILLFLFALSAVLVTSPGKPFGKNIAPHEFSAERAFEHIRSFAQKPHMVGSAFHDSVCTYIASELEGLGAEVDIQTTTATNNEGFPIFGNITNVIGRIRGEVNSKAILVVGHYDSQPFAPGAADDGIAVGSMLEAAKVLLNGPKLKNDIIFLFSDAEEVGLLGAKAFADEHPWAKEVGLVLNLEARGNTGAVLAFEVSPQNGWIIKEFVKGVERPFAGSMMYEVYKLMPNDTDFTIFKNQGFSGFNVALVQGFVNYHSATDKPENLDLGSVQHMGNYVMGVTKHFGNLNLDSTKSADLVYFNVFGTAMVYFPVGWNIWIFVATIVLFIIFLAVGYGRREISVGQVFLGFIGLVFALAISVGLVWAANIAVKSMYPHYNVFYMSTFYNVSYYFYAYMYMAFTAFVLVYGFILRQISVHSAMASIFFFLLLVTGFILLKLPTASYLTLVPLFFLILALTVILLFDYQPGISPFAYHTTALFGAIPGVFIVSPYVYLIFHIFGLKLPITGVGMLVLVLLYNIPLLSEVLQRFYKMLLSIGLIATMVFLLIAHFSSAPSSEKPLQSNVMFAVSNVDSTAYWVSKNQITDDWNKQFFTQAEVSTLASFYPDKDKPYLMSNAPFVKFDSPSIENIVFTELDEEQKQVEFTLKSNLEPNMIDFVIPESMSVSSVGINGKMAHEFNPKVQQQNYYLRLLNPSEFGDAIRVVYHSNADFAFTTLERKLGIPLPDGFNSMPPHIIPDTDYESYATLVKNSFKIKQN